MIKREPNSKRKSLRVAIPLYVEIGGITYGVSNWSTTGIGVVGLADPPQPGTVVPARISFPMLESTLTIAVGLEFRAQHEEVFGFDFHELSDAHQAQPLPVGEGNQDRFAARFAADEGHQGAGIQQQGADQGFSRRASAWRSADSSLVKSRPSASARLP